MKKFRIVTKPIAKLFGRNVKYLKLDQKTRLYELMAKYNIPKRVILCPVYFSASTLDQVVDYLRVKSIVDKNFNSKKASSALFEFLELRNSGLSALEIVRKVAKGELK